MGNVRKKPVKSTLGYHAVMTLVFLGTTLLLCYPVSLVIKRPGEIYLAMMFLGSFLLAAAGFLIALRLKKIIGRRHMPVKIAALCQAVPSAVLAALAFSGVI